MTGKLYTIRKGDTLWDIAKKQLADPLRWPEIYNYNNRSTIVTVTGTRIINPNLIFVGQKIIIRDVSAKASNKIPQKQVYKSHISASLGKGMAKKGVKSIPFAGSIHRLITLINWLWSSINEVGTSINWLWSSINEVGTSIN